MRNWQAASRGAAAGLGSGASFTVASLAVKSAYDMDMSPWALLAAGSLLSLPLLLPWARNIHWGRVLPAGAVGALSMTAYNIALARLDLSLTVILAYTFPVFSLLLIWRFRGTSPTAWQIFTVGLCLTGVAVVSGNPARWGDSFDLIGALCALVAAALHAGYGLLGERLSYREGVHAVWANSLLTVLMATVLAPGAVASGAAGLTAGGAAALWLGVAVYAVFGRILPMWLFSTGSRLAGAGPVALMATVELPLSVLVGVMLLGDRLSPVQWIGATLVVIAILLSRRQKTGGLRAVG